MEGFHEDKNIKADLLKGSTERPVITTCLDATGLVSLRQKREAAPPDCLSVPFIQPEEQQSRMAVPCL